MTEVVEWYHLNVLYVFSFGNLMFHEGSESGHKASQKMLLPLDVVLKKESGISTARAEERNYLKKLTALLRYQTFIPLKVFSLGVFTIFKELCSYHHNVILEHPQLPFDECF